MRAGQAPQGGLARAAVILVGPASVAMGVYERVDRDRLRAHARRVVECGDWPAAREALRALAALARARRAQAVTLAVRASVTGAARRAALAEARALGCRPLPVAAAEEARWLFLGALRDLRAQDGLVADLEPEGVALARWRGRVLATTARLGLREPLVDSGLPPGGEEDALVVSGSLAVRLAARAGAEGRGALLTRSSIARLARARSRDPLAAAALAARRLMDWTGKDAARVAPDALIDGLAATVLRVALPSGR